MFDQIKLSIRDFFQKHLKTTPHISEQYFLILSVFIAICDPVCCNVWRNFIYSTNSNCMVSYGFYVHLTWQGYTKNTHNCIVSLITHNTHKIPRNILLVCQGHYSQRAPRGDVCISQADSSLTNWTALSHSEWWLGETNLEREHRMSEENKTVNAMPIFQISNYISIVSSKARVAVSSPVMKEGSIHILGFLRDSLMSSLCDPHNLQPNHYIFLIHSTLNF